MAGELAHLHELPVARLRRPRLRYGLYATFALLALIFVIKAVRETKGRELEDM